jgi:hypothetical protein
MQQQTGQSGITGFQLDLQFWHVGHAVRAPGAVLANRRRVAEAFGGAEQ